MIGIFLILVHFSRTVFGGSEKFDDGVCDSEKCKTLSDLYLLKMNLEADPCDDFYEFACGNYEKNSPPTDQHTSTPEVMSRILEIRFKESLENWKQEKLSYPYELVVNYTRSCINEKRKDSMNHTDLKTIIDLKFGGWHLFDNETFNEENFQWEVLAGNLSLYGIHAFFEPVIWFNEFNSSYNIFGMISSLKDVVGIGKMRQNWRKQRFDFIHEVFDLLEIVINDTKIITDLVDFEQKLIDVSFYTSGNNTYPGFLTTFGKFKKQYDNINWKAYFVPEVRRSFSNSLTDSKVIQNMEPDVFELLNKYLKTSSNETIKNYLMLKLMEKSFEFMSEKYRNSLIKYLSAIYEPTHELERNLKSCAKQAMNMFPLIIGREYVKKYYNDNITLEVSKMFETLKEVMIDNIKNRTWMEQTSKNRMISKIKNIMGKFGYPEILKNETAIKKPYGKVKLNPNHYLRNFMKINKINYKQLLGKIDQTANSDWGELVTAVNAFFAYDRNEVIIPAAYLGFPHFSINSTVSIKYGVIGAGLAHEMMHGFDNNGRHYDEQGRIQKWWDDLTREWFENQAQCFIDQYDSEVEVNTGDNFDGIQTLNENIADNGAIRAAWNAYKLEALKNLDARRLPKFENYTSDQLFFIAYADNNCVSANENSRRKLMQDYPHAFGATRLNVPLRNFPKFGEVFNCKMGSGMMPMKNETCQIW